MCKNSVQVPQHLLSACSRLSRRSLLGTFRSKKGGDGEESPSPSGIPSVNQKVMLHDVQKGKNNSCLGLLSHAVCIMNSFNIPRLLTTCICICMMHICKYIYLTLQDKPQQRQCHKGMLAASQVFSMPSETQQLPEKRIKGMSFYKEILGRTVIFF